MKRGYGSARARTEQSGERGEDPGTEERERSDPWARSASGRRNERELRAEWCAGSGELGSGSGPRGERSWGLGLVGCLGHGFGCWAAVPRGLD